MSYHYSLVKDGVILDCTVVDELNAQLAMDVFIESDAFETGAKVLLDGEYRDEH